MSVSKKKNEKSKKEKVKKVDLESNSKKVKSVKVSDKKEKRNTVKTKKSEKKKDLNVKGTKEKLSKTKKDETKSTKVKLKNTKTSDTKSSNIKTKAQKNKDVKELKNKSSNTKSEVKSQKLDSAKNKASKEKKKHDKAIFDPTYEQDQTLFEEDDLDDQKEVDFRFSKEKDLEKDLEKDDNIIAEDDEEEEEDDDEKKALHGFEQDDIFKDVPIDDPVRMYLKEIGQYDLLTPKQEIKLAKEKQEAQDILKSKNFEKTLKLSKEDAMKLPLDPARSIKLTKDELRIVKTGEVAQDMLINRNLRLVVSIAKRYIGHGLSLLDLIQEGNLGLVRGIEKFNYKKGFKLSTYVTWWIRQAVSRALADQSKTIRIPVHMVETINKLNKVKKKLTTELGYEPTVKQIAKKMKLPESKVEEVMQIALDPISLDKPVGDEDDSIVADFIADQNVMSPEKYAEMEMLKEQVQELLGQLKERERKVLVLRFGIGDDRARTLEEVGKELKVTRERIRQIEDKALRKLGYKAKYLKDIVI